MRLPRIIVQLSVLGILLGAQYGAGAEEITLKNGQKIVGTIVGYEKDMFRVETEYGIALVRKDKVASIVVTKSDSAAAGSSAPASTTTSSPATLKPGSPLATPPDLNRTVPAAEVPAKPLVHVPAVGPPAPPTPPSAPRLALVPSRSSAPMLPPVLPKPPDPPSHPVDVPMPAHLADHVEDNTYFSDTFQFSMYKPPDWKIIEGVPKETGSGIMAMGTDDEQTLLIVDRQVWSGVPKLTSDEVESRLRQTYKEYRRTSEDATECDGRPAVRRTFTGVLDGAEWHGIAVHVIYGNTVFGILGLTSAETYQFQEAVFNKIIKTLHFTGPAAAVPNSSVASPQ